MEVSAEKTKLFAIGILMEIHHLHTMNEFPLKKIVVDFPITSVEKEDFLSYKPLHLGDCPAIDDTGG